MDLKNPFPNNMLSPVQGLAAYGQAVWLDYIHRSLFTGGELKQLVAQDGVSGITTNPAIFAQAMAGSGIYRDRLQELRDDGLTPESAYEQLAILDVQDAADLLRPVYERTNTRDGYVSLEVSPHAAHDARKTVAEAQRLWTLVGRDNLMIKVPATSEGLLAISELIYQGINVNATLLFSWDAFVGVAAAFLDGLEQRAADGKPVASVASVASVFISRIDTAVDVAIQQKSSKLRNSGKDSISLDWALGRTGIAVARLAYRKYRAAVETTRWKRLQNLGAQSQRLLWASTSTKNPAYRDVRYIEELIGPETVTTTPLATLSAFRDHGKLRESLVEDVDEAVAVLEILDANGIYLPHIWRQLLAEGLASFRNAYDQILDASAVSLWHQ